MNATMQAIGFRRYGPEEVLEPLELPIPPLGPDTVRVRVAAAGVNPADWRFRSGEFRWVMRLALTICWALAGIAAINSSIHHAPLVAGAAVAAMLPVILAEVVAWRRARRVNAEMPALG